MQKATSWRMQEFLRDTVFPLRRYFYGMAFATIIWAIDDSVIRPYLLKLMIDSMSHELTSPLPFSLGTIIGIYLLVRLCITLLIRWSDWLSTKLVPALKASVLDKLTSYVLGHAYGFSQQRSAGALAGNIQTTAESTPQMLLTFVGRCLGSGCRVLCAIILLWMSTPSVALPMTLWVIFFLGGGLIWAYKAYPLADEASRTYAQVSGGMVDLILNRMAVLLFNRELHEQQVVAVWSNNWAQAERNRDIALLKLYLVQGLTFLLFEGLSLWCLVKGFYAHTLGAGDAGLVVSVNMVLLEALWDIPQEISHVVRSLGRVIQGLSTITVPYELVDAPDAPPLRVTAGRIRYEKVTFAYADAPPLFSNLSIEIAPGQKVGLVGFSGSGKTTFVNLIMRLFDAQSGVISIDNQAITQITQASLRSAITFIPQEPILFRRSIKQNIQYGNPCASDAEIIRAARKAHIHEGIVNIPYGYNALIQAQGIPLSTGQCQRILIARALLREADIVIMDEATSAIDSMTERALHASITELTASKTTLIIAHRLSTLVRMDRILVFDSGKIVEDGTHEDLFHQNGIYRAFWDTQTGGILKEK